MKSLIISAVFIVFMGTQLSAQTDKIINTTTPGAAVQKDSNAPATGDDRTAKPATEAPALNGSGKTVDANGNARPQAGVEMQVVPGNGKRQTFDSAAPKN